MKDGGPAFPGSIETQMMIEHDGVIHPSGAMQLTTFPGMSLRDYFAAKAMQGLSTTSGEYRGNESGKEFIDGISKISYMIADAMIEARNK
jgi:hypothetical protein